MELPEVNQRVYLKVLKGPFASTYSTYVEEKSDQAFAVVHPWIGSRPLPLAPGDVLRVEFGMVGYAKVAFPTSVLAMQTRGIPVLLLAVPQPKEVERYQQRDFVRIQASLPVKYGEIAHPDQVPKSLGASQTRDLSGSGAQIRCDKVYLPGNLMHVELVVSGRSVRCVGEVIRTVEEMREGQVWVGIRFLRLVENDRERMIRFIFQEQSERRRRGLL
jgi:c-di-GMP-binding flagellar brake protein YcgR